MTLLQAFPPVLQTDTDFANKLAQGQKKKKREGENNCFNGGFSFLSSWNLHAEFYLPLKDEQK